MTFKEFMNRAKRADKKNMVYAGLCLAACVACIVIVLFF